MADKYSDISSVVEYSAPIEDAEAPKPIPVGKYPAEIIEAKARLNNETGKRGSVITVKINPANYPATFKGGEAGVKLSTYPSLEADNESGRFELKQIYAAAGKAAGKALNLQDLLGATVMVEVKHEKFNERMVARATSFQKVA